MCGGDTPVDQPGMRGEERTGAHADDAAGVLGRDLHPAQRVRVTASVVDTHAAGQDQRVEWFTRVGQRLGHQRQPGQRGGGFPVASDDTDRIPLVRAALTGQAHGGADEHLERADQVESLDARVSEDGHRSHEPSVEDRLRGV
jgi:hypothetical protein